MSEYYESVRGEVASFLPKKTFKRALEVGCGVGNFSQNIVANEYWGNDLIIKKPTYDFYKFFNGDFLTISKELPNNYFDLIICNDVIEHIDDYETFLKCLKLKSQQDAIFIFSIPNVRFFPNLLNLLVKKDWHYKSCGILDQTHLRFFTKKSIIRLFKNNNFQIDKIQGINRYRKKSILNIFYFFFVLAIGLDSVYPQFVILLRNK